MADTELMNSEAVEGTSMELFWGKELSAKSKTYEYTGESDEEEGIETTIELRGACLGVNAKNERNVVNLTTEDMDGNNVTHTILSMRLEKNEQVPLFLNVKPPLKLELIQGSGPISIVGNMTSVLDGDMSDDEEEPTEDQEETAVNQPKRKMKRPAESPIQRPAKKNAKITKEESDEEDSEMDASFDLPLIKKNKTTKLKPEQDNDEDDEEDDDDDEDDDDMSDDDDDDDVLSDSDDDISEEEVKPVIKKSGKGQMKKPITKGASQTPKPKKLTKPILKQPTSAPKDSKKTAKASPSTPSIDDIKKRLISSPGLPKKMDKFHNLLKNNYKINDDNTKKELWEFVQKSKKV